MSLRRPFPLPKPGHKVLLEGRCTPGKWTQTRNKLKIHWENITQNNSRTSFASLWLLTRHIYLHWMHCFTLHSSTKDSNCSSKISFSNHLIWLFIDKAANKLPSWTTGPFSNQFLRTNKKQKNQVVQSKSLQKREIVKIVPSCWKNAL